MIRAALCAGLIALAAPVAATEVTSCDSWIANARNVDWADPTRTYANGDIRLVALDTEGEPACCSSRLMVLFLSAEGPFFECALVTRDGHLGWAGLALSAAQASYDPARGLTVAVPVDIYAGDGPGPSLVSVTINRATGVVTAQ